VATLKQKGDLAELKVATDLISRGCRISLPFGEDSDYDLIADYQGRLHRVQVKYTQSDGQIVVIRCRSHSLTKGKVRATKLYTSAMIDYTDPDFSRDPSMEPAGIEPATFRVQGERSSS
jgi:hypothetical protein